MKFQNKFFVSIFLALVLIVNWIHPAYAATVISVSPSSIINDVNRTITITGTGFDNTAIVLLDGAALATAFVDAVTLTATVPAGTSVGTHVITVTMGGAPLSASLNLDVTDSVAVPPTAIPTSTSTPSSFVRPQLVIDSYKANVSTVQSGQEFKININFDNAGTSGAFNVQAAFTSADLVPTKTGGVVALGSIAAGAGGNTSQTFLAADSIFGKTIVIVDVALTYYDVSGTSYSDKFTLSVPAGGGTGGVSYPTSTPTGLQSGQLIIPSYGTTIDPLQPGSQFTLAMTVQNVGNDIAQRVTMIVGGGSSGTGGSTPQPGGVSGGGGEFTNFAPVGTSNVQSLGDLRAGSMVQVSQDLIVNVSTNPGAYPMKITFSYLNDKGEVINDEQVITLLVFSLPNVDVSFYRPPDLFFAGQPGALPIQVVNLGKRTAVLGNMTVTSTSGIIENGSTLVGSLDAGGYFTLDSTLFPDLPGTVELNIVIEYTDDFNQPRTVEKTIELTVEEGSFEPMPDPSTEGSEGGEVFIPPGDESFLQKTWRFILGLLGLDSAPPASTPDMNIPPEKFPLPPVQEEGGAG
ncbi:MAG: IPT/TIG domain-containing protein [Anaerolineales bacterium]|nr:IPT/TIG domain-containing protein [Anaerolineales bacterium]